MEGSDILLTISELAVGIAGFSGVVVAFAFRGMLRPSDRSRFIIIFTQALNVLALAFLPFFFDFAGYEGERVWRDSSGVAVVFWAINTWLVGFRFRPELSPEETFPRGLELAMWAAGFIYLSLHVANLVGWPAPPGPLWYTASLVLLLLIAATFFAQLVVYRAGE